MGHLWHRHMRTRSWNDPPMMMTISFANPYLTCIHCREPVAGVVRFGENGAGPGHNRPCGHPEGTHENCSSWSPVDGCMCQKEH